MPRSVDMNGREVMTAIVRAPSTAPLEVVDGGIAGNQPAVHTEHVLAFPAAHYDYWSNRLGTPREDWDWCWFGENLTVDGITEEDLHIGDVIEAGSARFRVTSPRIPCFKVAWRVGQPDSVLPKMMETGRVGFHLEVLEPGRVLAGAAGLGPARGLHVGRLPRFRAERAERGRRVKGAGPDLHVVGLQDDAALLRPEALKGEDQALERALGAQGVGGGHRGSAGEAGGAAP